MNQHVCPYCKSQLSEVCSHCPSCQRRLPAFVFGYRRIGLELDDEHFVGQPETQSHLDIMQKVFDGNVRHRVKWGVLVACCILCVALLSSVLIAFCFGGRRNGENVTILPNSVNNTFAYARDKIAVATCGDARGAAFVLEMGGRRYIVTNEHVLRGGNGKRPTFHLLDGGILEFRGVEVAEDRDLVRLEVLQDPPSFELSLTPSSIGDEVKVFGNSEGGGVVTEIVGRIQGVGPNRIEVDAKFVRGNSGSPVIDGKGNVLGVATFITCNSNRMDWTKSDTRFNGVRRYAVRMNGVNWRKYDWDEYSRQAEISADISAYCEALGPYLLAFYGEIPSGMLAYDESMASRYLKRDSGLHAKMMHVAHSYENLKSAISDWRNVAKERESYILNLRAKGNENARSVYLEVFDEAVISEQAGVIESIFDFNAAKAEAIDYVAKMIHAEKLDHPLILRGYEESDGLHFLTNALNTVRRDLAIKLREGDVNDIAMDLLNRSDENEVNSKLGARLLFDWAVDGDDFPQRNFVKMWQSRKIGMEMIYLLDASLGKVYPWFLSAYNDGFGKAAYVLGEYAYVNKDYKMALRFWEEAAKNGWSEGWVRIGKFYSWPQDKGGGTIVTAK